MYGLRVTPNMGVTLLPFGYGVLYEVTDRIVLYDWPVTLDRDYRFAQHKPNDFNHLMGLRYAVNTTSKKLSLFLLFYYYRNLFNGYEYYFAPDSITEEELRNVKLLLEYVITQLFYDEGLTVIPDPKNGLISEPLTLQNLYDERRRNWMAYKYDQTIIELP